jgi:hypothetical protein
VTSSPSSSSAPASSPFPSSGDLWLLRTADNRLDGPYTKAELCQLIEAGELGPQDEVCRANHYWISLHEQQEVMDQLGIRPQFQKSKPGSGSGAGSEDEITETQTEVNEVDGTPAAIGDAGEDIPDLPDEAEFAGTAVIRRAKKLPGAKAAAPTGPLQVSVRGISRMERPSIWRGAAWILILAAGVLIYSVLKILRT